MTAAHLLLRNELLTYICVNFCMYKYR